MLHRYQLEVVDDLVSRKRCALFLDMGLGKTAIILSAVNRLIANNPGTRVLVTAPKQVIALTYPAEIQKFASNLTYYDRFNLDKVHLRVDNLRRSSHHDILLVSYSLLTQFLASGMQSNYNVLVVDESTKFKGHSSKTLAALKRSLHCFEYRYIMTGTPIPNGYLDLYSQIYLLDEGERLGRSYYNYTEKYFDKEQKRKGGGAFYPQLTIKPDAEETIKSKVADLIICRTKEQLVSDLPEFISTVVGENLTPKLTEDYRQLKRNFMIALHPPKDEKEEKKEETEEDKKKTRKQKREEELKRLKEKKKAPPPTVVSAKTAADLANKLLQYCSGAIYFDSNQIDDPSFMPPEESRVSCSRYITLTETDHKRGYMVLHDLKLEMLRDVFKDHQGRILLAYNYRHEAERIQAAFPDEVFAYDSKRPEGIKLWEAGQTPRVLMTHPASIGHGVNLQYGCNVTIWFGFTWRLELYQQFNKRLHRQGQQLPVYCIHLAVGDIEYKLLHRLSDKSVTQQELLDYMRECGKEAIHSGFLV